MDIFAGDDLRECYNYDMGSVTASDDIGKLIGAKNICLIVLIIGIVLFQILIL